MNVKLNQIPGLLFERKSTRYGEPGNEEKSGFNQALDLQGERCLTLNREKLAIKLYLGVWGHSENDWKELRAVIKQTYYKVADSIISNLSEILESVKE